MASRLKRSIAMLMAAILTATAFSGCNSGKGSASSEAQSSSMAASSAAPSSSSSSSAASSSESSKAAGGNQQITFAMWGEVAADAFKKIQNDFNAQNNGYTLQIDMNSNYAEFLNARMASNDLPDIFDSHPGTNILALAKEGILLDLTDQPFVSQLDESTKKTISLNGKTYAYPTAVCYSGIYYNKKIFKQAGITEVPKTISELKADCEKIKALGIDPFAVSHKDSWTECQEFYSIASVALGDDMANFVSDMNAGKTSFAKMKKWNNAMDLMDLVGINYVNKNPMDSSYANMTALFANEKAAMYSHGCWSVIDVTKINPKVDFGVFAFPVSDDPKDAKLMKEVEFCQASPAYTKVKDGVAKFYAFMADPKYGLSNVANEQGRIPAISYPVAEDKLSKTYSEAMAYVKAGETVPWVYYQIPYGMDEATNPLIQDYVNKKYDRNQFATKLDEAWKQRNEG